MYLKQSVEDEYHFILECDKYVDSRKKYIKSYYWQRPSCFKLVQLLSLQNHNEKKLNNLGKYLCVAEKLCNSSYIFVVFSFSVVVTVLCYLMYLHMYIGAIYTNV